ncbi:MAG: DUF58 domain-containing protein [Planctomycetota bacterium]
MIVTNAPRLPQTSAELLPAALARRIHRLDIASRRTFPGKLVGERRSKERGQSVEFEDHRPYAPGDDLRHIDWRVFARLDRLVLKVFREDRDLAVHILLDASPSMLAEGTPPAGSTRPVPKLAHAARLAAALSAIALSRNNRCSVGVFGAGPPRALAPLRGARSIHRLHGFILDAMASAVPTNANAAGTGGTATPRKGGSPDETFLEATTLLAARQRERGIVLVLSDFLVPNALESGLGRLAAAGTGRASFETTCVQCCTPQEIDPAQASSASRGGGFVGDLRLTDAETFAGREVTVSRRLLEAYVTRFEQHTERLRSACAARGFRFVRIRTDEEIDEAVTGAMRQLRIVG